MSGPSFEFGRTEKSFVHGPTPPGSGLIQERGSIFEISGGPSLREPVTHRFEKCTGFLSLAPRLEKPAKARGGSQFPRPSLLTSGDFKSLPEARLGGSECVFCRADEQQLAFDAVQFGLEVQLSAAAGDCETLFESRQCVFGTLRLRQCLGEQRQEKWSPHSGSRSFIDS